MAPPCISPVRQDSSITSEVFFIEAFVTLPFVLVEKNLVVSLFTPCYLPDRILICHIEIGCKLFLFFCVDLSPFTKFKPQNWLFCVKVTLEEISRISLQILAYLHLARERIIGWFSVHCLSFCPWNTKGTISNDGPGFYPYKRCLLVACVGMWTPRNVMVLS